MLDLPQYRPALLHRYVPRTSLTHLDGLTMQSADDIFRAELAKRGIAYSVRNDNRYEIQIGDRAVAVSLDNVCLNYQRDGDADAIERFVDQLDADLDAAPSWRDVSPFIRYCLEPSAVSYTHLTLPTIYSV